LISTYDFLKNSGKSSVKVIKMENWTSNLFLFLFIFILKSDFWLIKFDDGIYKIKVLLKESEIKKVLNLVLDWYEFSF